MPPSITLFPARTKSRHLSLFADGVAGMEERSQNEEGELVSAEKLRSILQGALPHDEIVYSFAYGSGVLQQTANDNEKETEEKMIDFVIAVKDAYRFHKENLEVNPSHYPGPFLLAADKAARVAWWQQHTVDNSFLRNPGLYFNVTDENFKYGVVQVDELSRDLVDWQYLYLAGRMHKPIVKTTIDSGMEGSIEYQQTRINLPAALSASLLLLSRGNQTNGTISEAALYTQIAALSYTGDPRMSAGAEDPEKVNKLVQSPGQLRRFSRLYMDALADLETQGLLSIENGNLQWDAKNPKAHQQLWQKLPSRLRPATFENPAMAIETLHRDLPAIVGPAARYQSLKGLATAGPRRSWAYAMRKLSKGLLKR